MSHSIFGERFYSFRQPAWHGLGHVLENPLTAVEALQLVGDFNVSTYPVTVNLPDGISIESDYRAIVRHPTLDDDVHRVFGVVKDYNLITPRQVAETWDARVKVKLETLGLLGYGENLFMSTKLPSFEVGSGDVVDMYMIISSPMDGIGSAVVRRAPVRVVCQNTLMMSARQSIEELTIRHTSNALETLGDFMESMYQASLDKVELFKEAYDILAQTKVSYNDALDLTQELYSVPAAPYQYAEMGEQYYQKKLAAWDLVRSRQERRVAGVMELWNGKVSGGDMPGMRDTAWKWYNCATEMENYRRHRGESSRGYNVLFGERSQNLENAFELAYEYAKGK